MKTSEGFQQQYQIMAQTEKKINQSFNRLVNAIRKMLEETGGHINHLI